MTADTWMTAEQCADLAGIRPRTWSSYVARGQAPAAVRFDPGTGRRQWSRAEVEQWLANRPGAGSRTSERALRRAAAREVTDTS